MLWRTHLPKLERVLLEILSVRCKHNAFRLDSRILASVA